MEQNQFTQPGEQGSAILVSGKLFYNDDGLILPTKGQQTRNAGQVFLYGRNLL